jgi:hypothetical protein
MEMSDTKTEQKKCGTCLNLTATRGNECPRCHAVLCLLAYVYCHWNPEELADLATALREGTIAELRKRTGARYLQILLTFIQKLTPKDMSPDSIRVTLATAIIRRAKWIKDSNTKQAEKIPAETEESDISGELEMAFAAVTR